MRSNDGLWMREDPIKTTRSDQIEPKKEINYY